MLSDSWTYVANSKISRRSSIGRSARERDLDIVVGHRKSVMKLIEVSEDEDV